MNGTGLKLSLFAFIMFLQLTCPAFMHVQTVSAQISNPFTRLDDAEIHVKLSSQNGNSIQVQGNFTNTRNESIQNLQFRFDLRQLQFHAATIGVENVTGTLQSEGRYTVLKLATQYPIESHESRMVNMELTSEALEERIGLGSNGSLEIYQMIYYLRPLNEYNDLTFQLTLRPHAILKDEQSAPLYPKPSGNHTDGTSMTFSWKIDRIVPGQERVFIAKYGIPVTVLADSAAPNYLILYLALAAFGGATIILILQRIPDLIRSMQPQIYSVDGSTKHEKEIIRLIAKKDGKCPQRVIYEELGLSQSMVSMLLTGLEERGVVRRFKEGRENIVHLIESA